MWKEVWFVWQICLTVTQSYGIKGVAIFFSAELQEKKEEKLLIRPHIELKNGLRCLVQTLNIAWLANFGANNKIEK